MPALSSSFWAHRKLCSVDLVSISSHMPELCWPEFSSTFEDIWCQSGGLAAYCDGEPSANISVIRFHTFPTPISLSPDAYWWLADIKFPTICAAFWKGLPRNTHDSWGIPTNLYESPWISKDPQESRESRLLITSELPWISQKSPGTSNTWYTCVSPTHERTRVSDRDAIISNKQK